MDTKTLRYISQLAVIATYRKNVLFYLVRNLLIFAEVIRFSVRKIHEWGEWYFATSPIPVNEEIHNYKSKNNNFFPIVLMHKVSNINFKMFVAFFLQFFYDLRVILIVQARM